MNPQFKRGIVELCVMSVLALEDMYGYKIIQSLSKHIDVNENTVYPILRRLLKDGYFETYLEASNEGAPRKYYRMTKKGYTYYQQQSDEWDSFIGGVYQIIHKGVKDYERISERFKEGS